MIMLDDGCVHELVMQAHPEAPWVHQKFFARHEELYRYATDWLERIKLEAAKDDSTIQWIPVFDTRCEEVIP